MKEVLNCLKNGLKLPEVPILLFDTYCIGIVQLLKLCLSGVPVCSGFCDEWYEACKEDQICVENVLVDYNFTKHEENYCPVNSSCKSYQAMYGNGKNLCEKMWGESYKYTMPDAEYSNCLMMDPSKKVKGIGITSVPNISLLALILFIMALMQ